MTLSGGGFVRKFVGQEVTGVEYDRLWALAKQWNPGYNFYGASSGNRKIPLLAFTPDWLARTDGVLGVGKLGYHQQRHQMKLISMRGPRENNHHSRRCTRRSSV